jgi:hypothetical protein
LLAGIIDYAGLFPPAKLPLDQAFQNYLRYRAEPDSWMLARFVCPAHRLKELVPYLEESGAPVLISVLGSDCTEFGVVLENAADFVSIREFRKEHAQQARLDTLEIRLSTKGPGRDLPRQLLLCAVDSRTARADSAFEVRFTQPLDDPSPPEHGQPALPRYYFELKTSPRWNSQVNALASALRGDPLHRKGLKVRCGGAAPSDIPSPDQVAFAIITCRDAGAPMKFTAGLHHPVRHYDAALQTHMHGFLNVFGAGVLAHARNLGEEQVRQILADEDPKSFVFEDDGFHWKDLRASVDEITAARQRLVTSFGSCSFEEPRDDLRALGLLS